MWYNDSVKRGMQIMKKTRVYLDMDGTIANLYGMENWLENLINEVEGLFLECEPFITEEELIRDHSGIPHGGFVFRTGKTGWDNEFNNVIEYSLKLDSNPAFTSSVIVAFVRAAYRLNKEGQSGCKTVFDIPPAYLSAKTVEELRKEML